jgi:4-amino-4-deoxy-L-arabinose transferase-like glycosyltransferase
VVLIGRARRAAVLFPVAVGLGLRLVVMVVAHLVSVAHGNHGFFFVDDYGYDEVGRRIAEAWRAGDFIDVTSDQYAGSFAFGYQAFVGAIYFLAGPHIIAIKLGNVLLGTAIVLMAALLASRLFGGTAGRRTAWLVALCPTLVWWSATMLKEALVAFLLLAVLVEVLRFWHSRALLLAFAALAGLGITRITAAIAATIAVALGLGVAALRRRRAVSWPSLAFAVGAAIVVIGLGLIALGRGNVLAVIEQYAITVRRDTSLYGTGHLLLGPADFLKTLVAPYPWAFGAASRTWYRALYPGMWTWYVLLPLVAVGTWRLRRQVDALLVVVPIAFVLVLNAFVLGLAFRQRSTVEPLMLLLAAVGFTSWRQFASLGALGLLVVAAFASVQSRSIVIGTSIAVGAAILGGLALRLSAEPLAISVGRPNRLEDAVLALRLPSLQASFGTVVARGNALQHARRFSHRFRGPRNRE